MRTFQDSRLLLLAIVKILRTYRFAW